MHILIEQKLQNLGVFAYSDIRPEQTDMQIYSVLIKEIELLFDSEKKGKGYEDTERRTERFKELKVKDFKITALYKAEEYYSAGLPDDYYYLIRDRSEVWYECSQKSILSGEIEKNVPYLVKKGSITYNSLSFLEGQTFVGVTGVTGYVGTGTVIKLKVNKSPNRLTDEEELDDVLINSLTKTDKLFPISSLATNKIYVYFDDFFVNSIQITYLKKPKQPNYRFPVITSGATLAAGKYETIEGNIVVDTITFQPFQSFVSNGTVVVPSGTKVRLYKDGDLEVSDAVCYMLIDRTAEAISIITQQDQQKIVNMKQDGIPS